MVHRLYLWLYCKSPVLYWRIHTFDQDPPETTSLGAVDEEVNIQAVGDEYSSTRYKTLFFFLLSLAS